MGVVEPAATLVRQAGLVAVSDAWRPIRLALLGVPEARLSDVKTAESHPVALQQCSKALNEMKIAGVEAFDTGAPPPPWPRRTT